MKSRWSPHEAQGLSPLEILAYQSRLLGAEASLVLFGGGNTSLKREVEDFRGRPLRALTVKGSGSDMKAAQPRDFPSLRLEDILPLLEREDMSDEEMVEHLARCQTDPQAPRPSIETLLHAFLPFASVVHTHADAILSLTNASLGQEAVRAALGPDTPMIPYRRPGFLLSQEVALAVRRNPEADGVVLLQHGLITWGDSPQEAYERHLLLVSRAEALLAARRRGRPLFGPRATTALPKKERRRVAASLSPVLRGAMSGGHRFILQYDDSPRVLEFTGSARGRELSQVGPATPDHLLRTRRLPLWVEARDPSDVSAVQRALEEGMAAYAEEYTRWFKAHATGDASLLDPYPRVVLAPGLGMWTLGGDLPAARAVAEIYRHTIEVVRGAQALGGYRSLSPQDAFDVEYWPLELYKLTLAPPEKELARRVALVTGAAGGIGSAIARRLAREGAHVALTDVVLAAVQEQAQRINEKAGEDRCLALAMDVADEEAVRQALEQVCLAFGGLDILVSNAGTAHSSSLDTLSLADWERSLAINATGHFLVAREAVRLMKRQGLGGSLVFIATKNVPAPGKGFGAYSAAKAAEAQLARVLAIENGPFGIRSNMVNPDAVFQGSNLWSPEVKEERARAHGVPVEGLEEFYRQRNLLQARITPEDGFGDVLFLASDRSSKTTGAMLPVDGGLPEAFPR